MKSKVLKFKRQDRKNKGITLIALVVTIVVLLILAAVSISMLGGENGIITQAIKAQEENEIAEEKEKVQLAATAAKEKTNWGEITQGNLEDELDTNIGSGKYTLSKSGDIFTVTYNDSQRSYDVDANGNVTEAGEANIIASLIIEGEKSTGEPPLPSSDFTHTEGTVDTGYVIKDSNGNEFVWVPVDRNQKIKINVTSKENIDSISLTDPYGDKITLADTDSLGKTYTNENVEPTINGTYTLTVTSGKENKTVKLNVTSLYALRIWELEMLTEEIAQAKGYESLDKMIQDGFDMEEGSTVQDAKNMITSMYKSVMFTDTEDYKQEVNENGGFYIARYEASYQDGNVVSKESTVANTSSSLENGKLWNNISQTDALSKSNSMYTSSEFTSSLLTGAAWDRILSWLEETGAVTSFQIVGDSKTWGNYSDDTFSGTTGLINTGAYNQTKKNNIYDLAGNLLEWTTEANITDYRVLRSRYLPRVPVLAIRLVVAASVLRLTLSTTSVSAQLYICNAER